MTAYRKAPAGTTVEVADGAIFPVDGFGIVEVHLNQPGTTTKPVKMISVAYMTGRSQNLLPTRKAAEQWGNPLVYYETKAVLGFPGERSLAFNFCPRKRLFSATGVRRTPSQEAALALAAKTAEAIIVEMTGQWEPHVDGRRSSSQGAALALAAKTAETTRTAAGQRRPCAHVKRSPRKGATLEVAAKAHFVMKVHHVLADPEENTREAPLCP